MLARTEGTVDVKQIAVRKARSGLSKDSRETKALRCLPLRRKYGDLKILVVVNPGP
jgi:hypothetical protein